MSKFSNTLQQGNKYQSTFNFIYFISHEIYVRHLAKEVTFELSVTQNTNDNFSAMKKILVQSATQTIKFH